MAQGNYTFEGVDLRDGALQKITEKRVWPQIVRSHLMWNRFGQKRGIEVNSRKREFVLRLYDGQVATFGAEGGLLPRTLPEKEVRAEFGFTKMLRGISFTPESMEQMKQPSSLMSMAERLDAYGEAVSQEMSRFFYGEGSGAVAVLNATVTVASAVLTVTVDDATDDYSGVGCRGTADIKIGSDYEIVEPAANTIRARIRVTDITSPTVFKATQISGTATNGVDGDLIVPPGTRPSGSAGASYAFHGIGYHVTTATQLEWQNTSPQDTIQLRSVTKDLNGAGLTLGYVNWIEDASRIRRPNMATGGTDSTLILSGIGQHRKFKQYLNAYRKYDSGATVLQTGGRGVANQFGNEWEVDPACPDTRIYNLDEDDFSMAVLKELSYVDNGSGGKFVLRPSGTNDGYFHTYDGWLAMIFEFVGRNPFKQGALLDVGVADIMKASEIAHAF